MPLKFYKINGADFLKDFFGIGGYIFTFIFSKV